MVIFEKLLLSLHTISDKYFYITLLIIVTGYFNINCYPAYYKYSQVMNIFQSFTYLDKFPMLPE